MKNISQRQNKTVPSQAVGCVIMASGLGRRFGGNKLLSDFQGKPLISYILDLARAIPFAQRLVVTRHEAVASLCRQKGIEVLCHDQPCRNDTVRLGLTKLLQSARLSGCLFCPADQPLLQAESLQDMLRSFSRFPDHILRLSFEGQAGSPVLFGEKYFPELLALPEGKGGSFLAQKYPGQVILVPARDASELWDVDTPSDLSDLLVFGEQYIQKNRHHCCGDNT